MPKYEIMLIIDPKSDIKILEDLSKSIFKDDVKKIEKLDRTKLAYPINNSNIGTYIVLNVETEIKNIKEFTRKVNLQKSIWRELVINLDAEKGKKIKSEIAAKKFAKRKSLFEMNKFKSPRSFNDRPIFTTSKPTHKSTLVENKPKIEKVKNE